MRSSDFRLRTKLAFLLLGMTLLVDYSSAQTKIDVMVSGPWAYVQDPDDSNGIIIIAPNSPHHGPVTIFSGEDADQTPQQPQIARMGIYNLEIPAAVSCPPPNSSNPPSPPATYPITVPAQTVKDVIQKRGTRFVVRMPAPCSYSSVRTSQSKIDPSDAIHAREVSYTDWMVLHYYFGSSPPAALLTGSSDDGSVTHKKDPVPFKTSHDQNPPAISIVLATDMPDDTDLRCDSTSNRSFRDAAGLFGRHLHVVFPELTSDKPAKQTHTYDDDCLDRDPKFLDHAIAARLLLDVETIDRYVHEPSSARLSPAQAALRNLRSAVTRSGGFSTDAVREISGFELPPVPSAAGASATYGKKRSARALPKVKSELEIQTAGAGDCRAAQLSITTAPQ